MAKTKAYLIGSYALRFDTSRKIANQLLEIAIENLGIDYIDRRNDEVAAVSLPQMKAVAKRLFAGGSRWLSSRASRKACERGLVILWRSWQRLHAKR